jgi:hypothetical protein
LDSAFLQTMTYLIDTPDIRVNQHPDGTYTLKPLDTPFHPTLGIIVEAITSPRHYVQPDSDFRFWIHTVMECVWGINYTELARAGVDIRTVDVQAQTYRQGKVTKKAPLELVYRVVKFEDGSDHRRLTDDEINWCFAQIELAEQIHFGKTVGMLLGVT